MEFKITMDKEPYDRVTTLMKENDTLNRGEEIAGWFTGEWSINWSTTESEAHLNLDDFIIPKQEVSRGDVDLDEESMLDVVREFGHQKSNRIKAHWHLHPFGKGETNWSSTDEEMIRSYMEHDDHRRFFVFLLSSNDLIKARVVWKEYREDPFTQEKGTFLQSRDNLPVEVNNEKIEDQLRARIQEKVTYKQKHEHRFNYTNTVYGFWESVINNEEEWRVDIGESGEHEIAITQDLLKFINSKRETIQGLSQIADLIEANYTQVQDGWLVATIDDEAGHFISEAQELLSEADYLKKLSEKEIL